jgi:hypothetical protein
VGAQCVQTPVDLSSFDPASLEILRRLDYLEQLVRDGGGDSGLVQETTTPTIKQEPTDRDRLLPCTIDVILEWNSLQALRGQLQHNGPAFPRRGVSGTQMTTSPPISGLDELEPRRAKTILDNFFNYVHVKNPVLDEQHTRQIVSRICMHGIDWSPEACLALLVCALGTIATPFNNGQYFSRSSDAYCTAESFFLAAKKRLGMLLGTSSLIEAQCMFLAGVYSMCCFERVSAWRFFMQSLTCCQTFQSLVAFRQDYGEKLDEAGQRIAAAEQAIYWSAWKSEREVNDDLNLPGVLFSELDIAVYPPFFPTPPQHDDEIPTTGGSEADDRERMGWFFYLSEISLLRLRRRTAKEIINFEPARGESVLLGLAQAVADRERQVANWIQALPEEMSLSLSPHEDGVCRFVLRGHLIDVYEMFYWPFVDWALKTGSAGDSMPLLQSLATKGLQIHADRIIANRPGFAHRHHGTFGMIMCCTRSALILLAAGNAQSSINEDQHEHPYRMPRNWPNTVLSVIRLLENWEYEAPDLSNMLLTLNQLWYNWKQTPCGQTPTRLPPGGQ